MTTLNKNEKSHRNPERTKKTITKKSQTPHMHDWDWDQAREKRFPA